MNKSQNRVWDIVVIGGGAAGMMAAATAAARGASVCLLEKNDSLGKKLRITGGGRCNVTNNKPNDHEMLAMYKGKGKFLFSTFSQYGVSDTVSWFNERNVALKEENEGRMFPTTDSAETIYETLVAELHKNDVCIQNNTTITQVEKQSDGLFRISSDETHPLIARHCIIATGGTSRPETGSTGDGFTFAETLGHNITTHDVALVPLITKENWVKQVSGIALTDIKITVLVDDKKELKQDGKILFTHKGVSGPTILNLSKQVGELLQSGTVTLSLNLLPTEDTGSLRKKITTLFQAQSNKKIRNVLGVLVPTALGKVLLKQAAIDPETPCHSVRVTEKNVLVDQLQNLQLTVVGLMGKDKAVISSGGVNLSEIDFRTMESKVIPNLYLVGDMLDIDRPSGGYSLQLCWSTGYVAGRAAAK